MSINLFIYGDRYILIDLTYVTHLAYFSYSHIVLVEAFYKRQSDFMTLLSFSKRSISLFQVTFGFHRYY